MYVSIYLYLSSLLHHKDVVVDYATSIWPQIISQSQSRYNPIHLLVIDPGIGLWANPN